MLKVNYSITWKGLFCAEFVMILLELSNGAWMEREYHLINSSCVARYIKVTSLWIHFYVVEEFSNNNIF